MSGVALITLREGTPDLDPAMASFQQHPSPQQFGFSVLIALRVHACLCVLPVTTCGRATEALELLREDKDKFDLVISDVYMPDMDGFKLLELVGLEMDLPVIMMSANGETSTVMKGITHGACYYLLKPVKIEELRNIWQHVVRKNKKKEAKEDEEDHEQDNTGDLSMLKPPVVWSVDLHQQFVSAVNQLGIDKAVPKTILELMNVHENVASHLQEYWLYLKRLSGITIQPNNLRASSDGQDAGYGGLIGLNEMLDYKTAVTKWASTSARKSSVASCKHGRWGWRSIEWDVGNL
ncbi:unnamed protein product [Sphagnum balticum]